MIAKRSVPRSLSQQNEPVRRGVEQRFKPRFVLAQDNAFGSAKTPGEARKILIVEDDYLVAAQMEQALKEAGFDIAGVVATAEGAIELAVAERVGLVIMDIRLAGQRDGIEAAIELFGRHGIRSIFATAHGDGETRKRAEAAQPLDWLQKPYSMISLIESVRKALSKLGKKN